MRFSHLYNASNAGSSRRYDSETGRGHRTSENTDSAESSPPSSPESSGALQGLNDLQIDRSRSNSRPTTQRRGLASRISSLFGGSKQPAPGPVSSMVETTVRIDRARAPRQKRLSAAETKQQMMNALAQLMRGEALVTVLDSLDIEVTRNFSVRRTALTDEGLNLVASYGSNISQAFATALALPTASRRADLSATMMNNRHRAGNHRQSSAPSESETLNHMRGALAQLTQGLSLEEIVDSLPPDIAVRYFRIGTTTLTDDGLALAASHGMLQPFQDALALPTASRRPSLSALKYAHARRSRHPENATQPPSQPGSDRAAQPRARTAGARPASINATPSQTLMSGGFVKASTAFLRPNATMGDVAAAAGLSEDALRTFLMETGLTQKGLDLVGRCDQSTQAAVLWNVHLGTTRRAEADNDAVQPTSPARSEDQVVSSPHAQPESPDFSGLPDSQWSGWARDTGTPYQEVMGPPGTQLPIHPSTPSWEVAGSPGPALSADSSLLGSHFPHWPSYPDTHGQEVMGPPGTQLPVHPSTPSWEVTGSPGPALSADSSLLGSHLSHWPAYPATPGQEIMGPPGSPLPADSNTTFGNLSSIGPYGYHAASPLDLNADPDEVAGPEAPAQPAASHTTFGDLSSIGSYGYRIASPLDLNADPDEVAGPEAPVQPSASDSTFRSLGSLGASTLRGDLQDDAHSGTWTFQNPAATPYGYAYGHGYDPYAAASSGWHQQASPAHGHGLVLANLPVGPLPSMTRESFLAQVDAQMGHASADGLNCLLDSLLQLVHNTRRWTHYAPPGISREVSALRNSLVRLGEADPHGFIDAEGANVLAVTLAANYRVRIQFIEEQADRSLIVHPVYGNQGRLIHILHTPGHFQPLWPKH